MDSEERITINNAIRPDGQRVVTKRKTFPSYVLVEMDLNAETQAMVASIPGASGGSIAGGFLAANWGQPDVLQRLGTYLRISAGGIGALTRGVRPRTMEVA